MANWKIGKLFYVFAKIYDLNPRFVIAHHVENNTIMNGHAWIQLKINNKWYDFDSTGNHICYKCVENRYDYISYMVI